MLRTVRCVRLIREGWAWELSEVRTPPSNVVIIPAWFLPIFNWCSCIQTHPWPVPCILQQGGIKSLKSRKILANGSQVWGKRWWSLIFHLQRINAQWLGADKFKAFHVNCHWYPWLTCTQTPPTSMIEAITVDSATSNDAFRVSLEQVHSLISDLFLWLISCIWN